jgi:hypothetical protein
MATVFDGTTLTITLDAPVSGVLDLNIPRLYSEWKEWQLASFQNMGYPPAFRGSGGDPINATLSGVPTFFLRNDFGWRLRPFDLDQTINITGQMAGQDPTLPLIIPTVGGRTVLGFNVQPIAQVETITTGSGVTQQDKDDIENQIFGRVVESTFTFEQVMRLLGALAAGDITQQLDGSYVIKGLDDATSRILGELGPNNGRDVTGRNVA